MTAGRAAVAVLVVALTAARPVSAHGFGDRYDLPVPLALWVAGAAIAVALSFVVIGVCVRCAATAGYYPRVNFLAGGWVGTSSIDGCGSQDERYRSPCSC
jgi:hypothetical protein